MEVNRFKKRLVVGALFFLPVMFLLFLYPSTHNYNALDIVKGDITELVHFKNEKGEVVNLKDNITVLSFLGRSPFDHALTALNLKELIYDKFKGFKRFQVVVLVSKDSKDSVELLKKELIQYDELKYWHFVFGELQAINNVYNSLRSESKLSDDLSSREVFIIDKERNQRGRLDDREPNQKEKDIPLFGLYGYDCIEVAELKNKMSEDMRILFTEYRQKRKGEFNSTTRRADDIATDEKK
jgi:hypothetical protein